MHACEQHPYLFIFLGYTFSFLSCFDLFLYLEAACCKLLYYLFDNGGVVDCCGRDISDSPYAFSDLRFDFSKPVWGFSVVELSVLF